MGKKVAGKIRWINWVEKWSERERERDLLKVMKTNVV